MLAASSFSLPFPSPPSVSLSFSLSACCVSRLSSSTHHPPPPHMHTPPLCLNSRGGTFGDGSESDVRAAWITLCAASLKGVPLRWQMILPGRGGRGGSITYKDSHCLPPFDLRLLEWIVSVREDPAQMWNTDTMCVLERKRYTCISGLNSLCWISWRGITEWPWQPSFLYKLC